MRACYISNELIKFANDQNGTYKNSFPEYIMFILIIIYTVTETGILNNDSSYYYTEFFEISFTP